MHTKSRQMTKIAFIFALPLLMFTAPANLIAQDQQADEAADETPYVIEKTGDTIPLDLTFTRSDGEEMPLREVIKLPTVLTLVYYRCPGICSPLLQELADNVDKCDLMPGADYQLLTVSFDPREDEELASIAHNTIIGSLDKQIPPDSWTFMTGRQENINRLADAVGFGYIKDKEDFIHSATVMFISPEGKITTYIQGLDFLPADLKNGIMDAKFGRTSNLMKRVQKFCYSYDTASQAYVLNINRLILAVSFIVIGVFILYLAFSKKKPKTEPASGDQS